MPVLNVSSIRRCLAPAALAATLLLMGRQTTCAQDNISTQDKFEAVFLFHFAQFVDWPANTFPNPQAPLVIGILGDDPFGNFLDQTVSGETVNGHPLTVQRYRNESEIKDCQMLFISSSEKRHLESLLTDLKEKPILTVSDINNFPENGGIIGFVTVDGKIRFKIDTDAARDANLTFSSKLLRLAQIVTPKPK